MNRNDPEKNRLAQIRWRQTPRAKAANRARQDRLRHVNATRPRPEKCEVCGEPGGDRKPHKLHYEHDHTTGAFRGWVCAKCNAILGFAKDDPALLRALALYLEASRRVDRTSVS